MSGLIMTKRMESLSDSIQKMPWENQDFYKSWLAQSFFYTSHSTRMLAFAAGWSSSEEQSFYRRSLSHIREEQGHDLMALQDLENLGVTRSELVEQEACRALWEPQFYKMQRDPKILLGYILGLEQLAVVSFPSLLPRIAGTYGPMASRFVRIHAEDDPGHVQEALEQIEKCSPHQRQEITKNFDQTCFVYQTMIESLEKIS